MNWIILFPLGIPTSLDVERVQNTLSYCAEYTVEIQVQIIEEDFFSYFNGYKIHTHSQTPIENLDFLFPMLTYLKEMALH